MVEKFCGFRGSIGNCKTSSKIARAIGFGYTRLTPNHRSLPAN